MRAFWISRVRCSSIPRCPWGRAALFLLDLPEGRWEDECVLVSCACLVFGLAVAVAEATPAISNSARRMLATSDLRVPIGNDHLREKYMNSQMRLHCNEALTSGEQEKEVRIPK